MLWCENLDSGESYEVELSEDGTQSQIDSQIDVQFLSEDGKYSYKFTYDANIMTFTDQKLDISSKNGANFMFKNNAQLVSFTAKLSDLAFVNELNEQNSTDFEYKTQEGSCDVLYKIIPNKYDNTVFKLKACDGQNTTELLSGLHLAEESLEIHDL